MIQSNGNTFDFPTQEITLFEGIPPEKIRSVLRCIEATVSNFQKGTALSDTLQASEKTHFLIEGEVSIVRYDHWGNRSILGNFSSDLVITNELVPSIYENNSFEIIANENCSTLDFRISQEIERCACCQKYISQLRSNLMTSLANMNMRLVKRLDTLSYRSTQKKLLSFLQEQAHQRNSPRFTITFNRQELADYLYIERSALSRELSKMQEAGIISYHRNTFVLAAPYFYSRDQQKHMQGISTTS